MSLHFNCVSIDCMGIVVLFVFQTFSSPGSGLRQPSPFVPSLTHLQLGSKAPSTVAKYKSGWLAGWAASKVGVLVILARPLHIGPLCNGAEDVCIKNIIPRRRSL